jgi:hypothetical protein
VIVAALRAATLQVLFGSPQAVCFPCTKQAVDGHCEGVGLIEHHMVAGFGN